MRPCVMELSNQEVKPFHQSFSEKHEPATQRSKFWWARHLLKEIKEPSEFKIRCPAVAFIADSPYIFDRLADR